MFSIKYIVRLWPKHEIYKDKLYLMKREFCEGIFYFCESLLVFEKVRKDNMISLGNRITV